ncbi:hypothetical protein GT360_09045 [Vibrio astriarenae]|uniref:Uncharacterized protein n=1 Tax=Vibrio astriarenae TaxID=1481923 RepID=A0A7Z2T3N4_9VIBR|nr:hypothetical protein [Vibrio astriarenae]QIA63652.1 hypothetical protein GT360_09045 [Vibrio astriarenae]
MNQENSFYPQLLQLGLNLPNQNSLVSCSQSDLVMIEKSLWPLYQKSLSKKPDMTELERFLGLFSYHHQDLMGQFLSQKASLSEMQRVFETHLETEHQEKFSAPIIKQLWLSSYIWLFLQGRMNLDFSLANDHATEVSKALSGVLNTEVEVMRCELNKAYYQGISAFQSSETNKPLWKKWFEKWLN